MASQAESKLVTGEDLLAMGDIGPCELIDGRIVPMSPTGAAHGLIESLLARKLSEFVEDCDSGWVLSGDVGIYTRHDPDRIRGADVVFVSRQQVARIPDGFLDFAPELVVEVISSTERWQNVREKLEEYFAIGVQHVWLVEPKARSVLAYRSATQATKYASGDTLRGEGSLTGFELGLPDLFSI